MRRLPRTCKHPSPLHTVAHRRIFALQEGPHFTRLSIVCPWFCLLSAAELISAAFPRAEQGYPPRWRLCLAVGLCVRLVIPIFHCHDLRLVAHDNA